MAGNGGGSEWCEDVARLFTTDSLRSPPVSFVKHEHWARQIERELTWIDEDLARDDLTPRIRAMLTDTRSAHEQLLQVVVLHHLLVEEAQQLEVPGLALREQRRDVGGPATQAETEQDAK